MAQTLLETRSEILVTLPEWQKLLEHLELADDNFAYIPLLVPDDSWAAVCENNLTTFLSKKKKKLRKFSFTNSEDFKNLAGKLLNLKLTKTIGAVWITAPIVFRDEQLEMWQEAWREGTARLNQYRNPLREAFPVTFIFVGGFWTQEITRMMAPDLWSIRTTVVRIEPPIAVSDSIALSGTIKLSGDIQGPVRIDPYFALQEAEKIRGKKGKEFILISILSRAALSFLEQKNFNEALKVSNEMEDTLLQVKKSSKNKNINLQINNISSITYFDKGFALSGLKNFSEAIIYFDKAISSHELILESSPNDLLMLEELAKVHFHKAISLKELGQLSEALDEYDKVIDIRQNLINPQSIEVKKNIAETYFNKAHLLNSLGRYEEAVLSINNTIEILENYYKNEKIGKNSINTLAKAYGIKGEIFSRLQRNDEAVIILEKAIELLEKLSDEIEPENLPKFYANKGVIFYDTGKTSRAITEYKKAIQLFENLIENTKREDLFDDLAMDYANLGFAYFKINNYQEAIKSNEKAINLWANELSKGEKDTLPKLVKQIRYQIGYLVTTENWKAVSSYIGKVLDYLRFLEDTTLSHQLKISLAAEISVILKMFTDLPQKNQKKIYKRLGANEEAFRQLIKGFEKSF